MKLIFNAAAIANIADNAGSGPLTVLWASLHTSDPGEAGGQDTNEASYTGYARVSVARTTAGFVVTNNSVSPVSAITFGQQTNTGTSTVTHAAVGTASSGAGKLLVSGTVTPNISMAQNVTPSLTTATALTVD